MDAWLIDSLGHLALLFYGEVHGDEENARGTETYMYTGTRRMEEAAKSLAACHCGRSKQNPWQPTLAIVGWVGLGMS